VKHTLQQLTTDSQGFFVTGKFEAIAGVGEPHAAILEAFSHLCDLTIQSSDFVQRKQNIQLEMGKNSSQLLKKAISNLQPLLEDDVKCDTDLDYEEESDVYNPRSGVNKASAFAKFKVACRSFLKSKNLLMNMLGAKTPSIDDLSHVIATKTRGNPFMSWSS
jgi:hypothetical protein